MKVDFFFVIENGRYGVECEPCGERFFDRMSLSGRRVLESAISMAIAHGNGEHRSTGGVFTAKSATTKGGNATIH